MLNDAMTVISGTQKSTFSIFDNMQNLFSTLIPRSSNQSSVSTNIGIKEQDILKVDNKDITDRLDEINVNLRTLIDLTNSATSNTSLTELDNLKPG